MHWLNKVIKYFLLLLFIGYYGSVTFFNHEHHIPNGSIIIHSHPFKKVADGTPVSHHHTSKELIVIQLLSVILTTTLFAAFAFSALKCVYRKVVLLTTENSFITRPFLYSWGLRAPPSII